MRATIPSLREWDSQAFAFYRQTLDVLERAGIPFLVGGAYALERYTGIRRHTKDFDIFVRPEDCAQILGHLAAAGYHTELTFAHWLGKAFQGDLFIDVIFGSGNGLCRVDERWFTHATQADVLGLPLRLVPPEEMIWSKAFIMERERFDGADIAHLIHARAEHIDWHRLLDRFGPHWQILLVHLILFDFIYPGEGGRLPGWLMEDLLQRKRIERSGGNSSARVCQGTLLSRAQYLVDIETWGYRDPRRQPAGTMSAAEIQQWTDAIEAKDVPAAG